MKNINYYKTPMDKAMAFSEWLDANTGVAFDPTMCVRNIVGVESSDAKVILFNAWLHSNVADTRAAKVADTNAVKVDDRW